ncbi:MAG: acetyl-CoA decarbonylase/synthase complex subunit gamma [Planctomycetota bacterium]
MALTGLDIFKLLPKTNCKDCGKPTCLAFAMALAQKKASLDECPHVSEEAKAALAGASAPPMKKVTVGVQGRSFTVGGETVMYRHEEKFQNPAAVAVAVDDDLEDEALAARIAKVNGLRFHRVGQDIAIDAIAVVNRSGKAEAFAKAAAKAKEKGEFALVLVSDKPEAMRAAVASAAEAKPLLYGATAANADAMIAVAKEKGSALAVLSDDLEELAGLAEKAKGAGVADLFIGPAGKDLRRNVEEMTQARRAALKKAFRSLGYPTAVSVMQEDAWAETAEAASYMAKYGGVIIMRCAEAQQVLPVLTVRQNLYTDPQKPVQVEPGLYKVGDANENSPLLFTTNFSLTYYTVESDVEASRMPAHILAVDTEGTSVLTAYSGEKLTEKTVADAMKKHEVEKIVRHKKLIIPGYVAVMSGKLEEATGWEVLVGPKESALIPKYLQSTWSAGA